MNWSTQKTSEVEKLLSTDVAKGLTNKIVASRLKEEGKNFLDPSLDAALSSSLKKLFFDMAHLPILCAIIMSFSYQSFIFGLLSLVVWGVFMVLYTFFYCRTRRRIARAAMVSLAPVKVLRDGKILKIPPHLLVRGDIVFLKEGDTVPSDLYLLESNSLKVYEASAFEGGGQAQKNAVPTQASEKAYAEMHNILFATSEILAGSCKAVCIATGHYTVAVREKRVPSLYGGTMPDFFRKIKKRISPVLYALFFLCIVMLTCGFLYGNSLIFYSFFVVAACLSSMPFACVEGLSFIGYGLCLDRLRRKKSARSLLKNPLSIDLLTQLDCIFIDTDIMFASDALAVKSIHTAQNQYCFDDFDAIESDELKPLISYAAALESCTVAETQAQIPLSSSLHSPEKNAMHHFFSQNKFIVSNDVKTMSFRSAGQGFYFDSVLLSDQDGGFIVSVGEASALLRSCANVWNHGKIEPISEQLRSKMIDDIAHFRQQGRPIIAYATARTSESQMTHSSLLHRNMTFLFFVVFQKRESGSLEKFFNHCSKRKLEPIVFHEGTIESAELLLRGHPFLQNTRICDGKTISETYENYAELLDSYEVFANFSREQKYKIFRELIDKKFKVGILARSEEDRIFLKDAQVVFLPETSSEYYSKMSNENANGTYSQYLMRASDVLVDQDVNALSDAINANFDYKRNLLSAFSYLNGMLVLRVLIGVFSVAFGVPLLSMLGLLIFNFLWDMVVIYHFLIGSFTKNAQPWMFVPDFRKATKRSINFILPFVLLTACFALAFPLLMAYIPKFSARAMALSLFWTLSIVGILYARMSFGIRFSTLTKTRIIPVFAFIALISALPFVSILFNVSFHWLSPIITLLATAFFALFCAVSNKRENKYQS